MSRIFLHCTMAKKSNQQVRFRRLPFRNSGITNFRGWASGNLGGGRTMISTNYVVNQYPFLGTKE
jgi:hypothetical protein